MTSHHRYSELFCKLAVPLLTCFVLCMPCFTVARSYHDKLLSVVIEKNDTLEKIFKRHKLPLSELSSYINKANTLNNVNKIFPGQLLEIYLGKSGKVRKMLLRKNSKKEAPPEPKPSATSKVTKPYKKIQFHIKNSLYVDGLKHGLGAADIQAITNLVKEDGSISLHKLPSMSKFNVVLSQDERPHIIALDIEYSGKKWSATEFKLEGHKSQYYHNDGSSLSPTFLPAPLKKYYVSSHFSLNRIHPILRVRKPHLGTDFAAAYGTPIWATAPGIVEFVGTKGGFGKVIIIRHDKRHTTTYAHLSRFSKTTKEGAHVDEKQIIGFVGKSGSATGSHLHYEVRIDGVPINPLGKKLPRRSYLTGRALAYFKRFRELLTTGN